VRWDRSFEKEAEVNKSTVIRRRLVAVLALALTAAAVFAGGGRAATGQTGDEQWLKAVTLRSEALNHMYGLGERATAVDTASAVEPAWLGALRIRSEALNTLYGLGTTQAPGPEYLRALELRGEGMNQLYGLGSAAPRATVGEGGFDWLDAGIGVAAAFGLMLLTGSAAVVLRRRGRLAHIRL
jgi:hypothetical protein